MNRDTCALILTGIWLILLLAGAGVLSALEGPHEQQTCEKAKSLFNDGVAEKAAQLTVEVSEELKNGALHGEDVKLVIMAESDFDNFITKIDEIYTLNRLSNVLQLQAGQCTDNWSFVNSIFNAGSMITSLGFAYTSPVTFYGKLFTAFYVLLGVPIFLLSSFLIGQKLALIILTQLLKISSIGQSLTVSATLLLVYSLTTLVPAAIISTLEGASFFDSWYFSSTTVSTVGFGDFKLSGVARAAWLLWVYVAVILQMAAFTLLYRKATLTEFEKTKLLGEEGQKLLDHADGAARYGAGMMYRPTIEPNFYHDLPPGSHPDEYRTLSTMPLKLVDPQVTIMDQASQHDTESIQSDEKSVTSAQ